MGRPRLVRNEAPCVLCGAPTETFAEELPVPLLCQPCRSANPQERPWVTCSLPGCGEVVRITGAQRRRWELGRPVYCSKDCRWEATHPETSCVVCGVPTGRRGAGRRDRPVCSPACQGKLDPRRLPDRRCPECGVSFRNRSTVRTCSVACGIRARDRRMRGAPTVNKPWRCPVCGTRCTSTDRKRWGRPCSKVCSNRWRNMPGWVPSETNNWSQRATQEAPGPYPAGP